MIAWAKFPSRWIKGYAPGEAPNRAELDGALKQLTWREHRSAATYAILVLIALAVLANRAGHASKIRPPAGRVAATYDQLEELTLVSRRSISRAIQVLEQVGALQVDRTGLPNVYTLVGVATGGDWCKLPQDYLVKRGPALQRLGFARQLARDKGTLNALKLYVLLLTMRDDKSGVARLGYDKIEAYAGIRREEIQAAISMLLNNRLCTIVTSEQMDYEPGERAHNRYRILGFKAVDVSEEQGLVIDLVRDLYNDPARLAAGVTTAPTDQ